VIDQPGANNQQSPASASMAMNADSASFRNGKVEKVHDLHHVFEGSGSHIFPALVEASDAMGEEVLGNVAEANCWNYSISAKWMLSWLLQVQNCANVVLFELTIKSKLFDKSF
jgi:hypothetical protein